MSQLEFHQFPCLSDNYGVLIHDRDSGATASIDAPEAAAVERALKDTGWSLTHILVTHHHADHTDGNQALKQKHGCRIVGAEADRDRIPGIDETVREGDSYDFAGHKARVIATPGHTSGHIAYHFGDDGVAFVGDTLFAMGCGRVFEGRMEEMWSSLSKLMQLPRDTVIYCGHEYTLANARFALSVDPDNESLRQRAQEVERLRDEGRPTLPTTLAAELETNPFLRAGDPALKAHLDMSSASDAEVFAEVRRRKDAF